LTIVNKVVLPNAVAFVFKTVPTPTMLPVVLKAIVKALKKYIKVSG